MNEDHFLAHVNEPDFLFNHVSNYVNKADQGYVDAITAAMAEDDERDLSLLETYIDEHFPTFSQEARRTVVLRLAGLEAQGLAVEA